MRGISRLAKDLGISTGTVSRALNGRPDVSEATRARVLDAARNIGYAPNQAARALAQGQTRAVGFMIDLDPETAASSDYFFMGVFDGVQSVLAEQGLDLLIMPCPTGQDHYSYLQRFATRGVFDAMILAAMQRDDPRIGLLQAEKIPFVTLGRSEKHIDHAWIDLDFDDTATIALERMIALGHRRIAVTVPKGEVNFGFIFLETYKRVLAQHGIAFDPALVVETRRTEKAGYEAMDQMLVLDNQPTAVLLIYEVTAIGVYRRLFESGMKPGPDMAVVGFRDEPSIRFLVPSLTCFSLSLESLGRSIGTALLAQIPGFQEQFTQGRVQSLLKLDLKQGDSDLFPPRRSRHSGQ